MIQGGVRWKTESLRTCEAMAGTIARIAAGVQRGAEEQRLARHARRCHSCRRHARELGIEPLSALGALRQKVAALLPLPWIFRRFGGDGGASARTSATRRWWW